MQDKKIYYQRFGEKCFQLTDIYQFDSDIKTGSPCALLFMGCDGQGHFTVHPGWCWDGPSGWAIPDKTTLRASLEHDAKYRAMREGLIDPKQWRQVADKELEKTMEEDGASDFRSDYFYAAVELFGAENATGGNPILEAP